MSLNIGLGLGVGVNLSTGGDVESDLSTCVGVDLSTGVMLGVGSSVGVEKNARLRTGSSVGAETGTMVDSYSVLSIGGVVERDTPVPVSAPTDDPVLNRAFFSTPTDDPTPSITPVLKSTPTHVLRSDSTSPPVLRFTPTPNPKPIFSDIL
ncbi:hypothetical protein BASA60_009596 [Batrachochytrium salamandrivorans]|nr:hypothetical protein BASA60_009596 [Batrachochytrium salamandrivorans]